MKKSSALGNKILLVCIGNICRSPAAEGFVADYFKKNGISGEVASAGIHAMVEHGPAPHTEKIMREVYGIEVGNHRARQITEAMMRHHDLVWVMEDSQAIWLKKNYPTSMGKIHSLGKWRQINIADPYQQPEMVFQECLELIHQCVDDWMGRFWS